MNKKINIEVYFSFGVYFQYLEEESEEIDEKARQYI